MPPREQTAADIAGVARYLADAVRSGEVSLEDAGAALEEWVTDARGAWHVARRELVSTDPLAHGLLVGAAEHVAA
jgi:hypothetical protein